MITPTARSPRISRFVTRVSYHGRCPTPTPATGRQRLVRRREPPVPASSPASRTRARSGTRATTTRPTRRPSRCRDGAAAVLRGVQRRPAADDRGTRRTAPTGPHVPLAARRADRDLPDDDVHRPAHGSTARRCPTARRSSRPTGPTRRGAGPRGQAARDPGACCQRSLGPVPGAAGGRHLRQRRHRLLARDVHPSDLHRGRRRLDDRPRERATSGGATTSRSSAGATSASTSASRRTRSGCGTSTTAPTSTAYYRPGRGQPRRSSTSRSTTWAPGTSSTSRAST